MQIKVDAKRDAWKWAAVKN